MDIEAMKKLAHDACIYGDADLGEPINALVAEVERLKAGYCNNHKHLLPDMGCWVCRTQGAEERIAAALAKCKPYRECGEAFYIGDGCRDDTLVIEVDDVVKALTGRGE